MKNSLLPIAIPPKAHKALFAAILADPATTVTVDLVQQKVILPVGSAVTFPIDEFARHCMLEGVDELGYILQQEQAIASFEANGAIEREHASDCLMPLGPCRRMHGKERFGRYT